LCLKLVDASDSLWLILHPTIAIVTAHQPTPVTLDVTLGGRHFVTLDAALHEDGERFQGDKVEEV